MNPPVLAAVDPGLRSFHVGWAWVVIVANGLAGLWALAAHRWEQARHRVLWWFTGAAEVAVAVQAVAGSILYNQLDRPKDLGFHLLYGFSGLFAIVIVYSYRGQMEKYRYLLYGVFKKVAAKVENQYVIGFYPDQSDGKWHKLKITVKAPKGKKYKISNRKGYLSPKAK